MAVGGNSHLLFRASQSDSGYDRPGVVLYKTQLRAIEIWWLGLAWKPGITISFPASCTAGQSVQQLGDAENLSLLTYTNFHPKALDKDPVGWL